MDTSMNSRKHVKFNVSTKTCLKLDDIGQSVEDKFNAYVS